MSDNRSKIILGEQLKLLREAAEFSQEEVAEKLYVARQTISSWECGRSEPDLASLRAICALYDTSVDALLSDSTVVSKRDASLQPQQEKPQLLKGERIFTAIGFSLLAVALWILIYFVLCNWIDQELFLIAARRGWTHYNESVISHPVFWFITIPYYTIIFVSSFFALYFAEKRINKGRIIIGGIVYSAIWFGYTVYSFVMSIDKILNNSLLFLLHLVLIVLSVYCAWRCFPKNRASLPKKTRSWHKKALSKQMPQIIRIINSALIAFLVGFVLTEIGVGFVDSIFSQTLHESPLPVAYWVLYNLAALFALGIGLLFAFFLSPCSTSKKRSSVIVYGLLNLLYFLWSFSIRFITKTQPISNTEGNVTAEVLILHLVLIAASALILFCGIRKTGRPAEEKRERVMQLNDARIKKKISIFFILSPYNFLHQKKPAFAGFFF